MGFTPALAMANRPRANGLRFANDLLRPTGHGSHSPVGLATASAALAEALPEPNRSSAGRMGGLCR